MFLTPWQVIKTDFSLVELAIANLSIRHYARQYKGEHRSELSSVEDQSRSKFKISTIQVKRKHGGFRGLRDLPNRMGRNLKSGHSKKSLLPNDFQSRHSLTESAHRLLDSPAIYANNLSFTSIFRLRA
jgi:hypothetical protein